MGKSKLKQQLKRKLPPQQSGANGSDNNSATLSKKQLKKQRREAAAAARAEEDDENDNANDGEMREIEDLDFDDAFAAGLAFEQMESFEGALAAFQVAAKARPDHLPSLSHLADVYAADEQPQQALKTYLQASKLSDVDASIWFRLGITYMSLEQHGAAIESLKKSLALSAEELDAMEEEERENHMKAYSVTLAALANCCGELGDLDGAVQVYRDAVARFSSIGNLHYNLATMLMAKGGGDSAQQVVQCLERAIECSPETVEFYEDLIEYLQQQNKSTKQKSGKVQQLQKKVEELKESEVAKAAAVAEQAQASDDDEEESNSGDDNENEDEDEDENTEDDEE